MSSKIDLRLGDCLQVMKSLPSNSVDAVVTDPPYGLSFMGKKWDYDVPSQEIWEEALRVLKPGGYLLAFAGTRTQHRMAVRIEDAGFEIRDMIMYVYGSGFPKSLNINKQLLKRLGCGNMQEYERSQKESKSQMSDVWKTTISKTLVEEENNNGGTLQKLLEDLEQGEQLKVFTSSFQGKEIQVSERQRESCLERWSNLPTPQGELYCKCAICTLPTGIFINGKKRWICYGTQTNNGKTSWEIIDENGMCTSYQSQSIGQSLGELNVICEQCRTQIIRSEGLGSALKPACEPITVARKPISEKNLADNFLKWGVGGIDIDGCRVGTEDNLNGGAYSGGERSDGDWKDKSGFKNDKLEVYQQPLGRFPANLIHDGSDEVVGLFPNTKSTPRTPTVGGTGGIGVSTNFQRGSETSIYADSGSAARFFYCAKASKSERNRGCEGLEIKQNLQGLDNRGRTLVREDGSKTLVERFSKTPAQNNHPTVKPIALMEYLVKLVSREGAIVLDPFMGSGSTGIACRNLKRNFIGIELDPEYLKIAEARINSTHQENLI